MRKRLCYTLLKAATEEFTSDIFFIETDVAGYSSLQKSNKVTIVRDLTASISASFTASFSVDLIGKFPCHFITRTLLGFSLIPYAFMKVTELVSVE